ncbi:hypothetical protein CIPAW_08G108500 [Carya illinoinensis]|uniref:Uncharacterized protein n=1 Tax=Carya illinoinensis TaxID=32201 RepID=A0A8T1PQF7_CARIL|nr:hypothetical protein CIPAW_08G108500 [Carya illinoinensis]
MWVSPWLTSGLLYLQLLTKHHQQFQELVDQAGEKSLNHPAS